MKKLLLLSLFLNAALIFAQDNEKKLSFGITAGFNYNSNGVYTTKGTLTDISQQFESEKKTGLHGGVFIQYRFNSMYFRPEVLYTKTKSAYDNIDFDQTKVEVPMLIGFDIIKPISIFLGPSIQYILENELENITVEDIDIESDLGINFQVGLALQLHSQIRLDIRYEKGISDNILTIKDDTNTVIGSLNTKPEQIILNISLSL